MKKGDAGLTTKKIQGYQSLRIVQYADMTFEDVFVPDNNKLEYATDFERSTGSVLLSSRVIAASGLTGLAIGAYEECLRDCLSRKQFGKPIASFQLI